MSAPAEPLRADRPVTRAGDDLLGMDALADALAARLERADGGVLVITWSRHRGAGRSTFLALLEGALAARGVPALRVGAESAVRELSTRGAGRGRPVLLVDDADVAALAALDAGESGPAIVAAASDTDAVDALAGPAALLVELPPWDGAAAASLASRLARDDAPERDAWARLLETAATPREAVRLANAALLAISGSRAPAADVLDRMAAVRRGHSRDAALERLLGGVPASTAAIGVVTPDGPDALDALAQDAARRGDSATLARLLRSATAADRRAACSALAGVDAPADPAPLRDLLASDDPAVRRTVCQALGRLEDVASAEALARLLDDPSADARRAAVAALPRLGVGASLAPLCRALEDEHAAVRMAAETALEAALPQLVERGTDLGAGAHAALARVAANARDELAAVARTALARTSGLAPAVALSRLLPSASSRVRHDAARALARCPDAARELARELHAPDAVLRAAAAEALGHAGDPRATGALLDAHASGEPALRSAAATSLVRLGWKP